jgi:hypothetical protein
MWVLVVITSLWGISTTFPSLELCQNHFQKTQYGGDMEEAYCINETGQRFDLIDHAQGVKRHSEARD